MSYALREAVAAFRRAPVLTGLSSAMVGLALFVVGLFALATHNLREVLDEVEERVEVVAYLRDYADIREVDIARQELASLPEVARVRYLSKEDALRTAREELSEFGEVFQDLEVNPLPASLELELREEHRNEEAVERVADAARTYPFVEDVVYGREWVEKLFTLRRVGGVTTGVLGVSFAVVAALIIGTALKIAVFARREEIYVMRLVGARDGFIRRPFLLEGAMAGTLGGGLAFLLTYAVYRAVRGLLFAISWVPGSWVVLGVASGSLFGVFAAWFAVRRHLREV